MAEINLINLGNTANDGRGDDLREAFLKVNSNFTNVNTELATLDQTSAASLPGGIDVYKQEVGSELQFRSLVAGNDIQLVENENTITIINSRPDLQIGVDNALTVTPVNNFFNIQSDGPIKTVVKNGENILLKTSIKNDPAPELAGDLQGGDFRVIADVQGDIYNTQDSSIIINSTNSNIYGNFFGNIEGVDFNDALFNFDFGSFVQSNITNTFELLLATADVEFGSFTEPAGIEFDLGQLPPL